MIAIVDYRAGNLASSAKAFDHLGSESVITGDPEVIPGQTKLWCPV